MQIPTNRERTRKMLAHSTNRTPPAHASGFPHSPHGWTCMWCYMNCTKKDGDMSIMLTLGIRHTLPRMSSITLHAHHPRCSSWSLPSAQGTQQKRRPKQTPSYSTGLHEYFTTRSLINISWQLSKFGRSTRYWWWHEPPFSVTACVCAWFLPVLQYSS